MSLVSGEIFSVVEQERGLTELISDLLVTELNWSSIEVGSLLICSCVPSFRPFIRQFPTFGDLIPFSTHGKITKRSTRNYAGSYHLESGYPKSRTVTNISTANATKRDDTTNDSQQEIIPEADLDLHDSIMVTTNFTVDNVSVCYSDKSMQPVRS